MTAPVLSNHLPARGPLPTCEEWLAALDLTREGREWHGPCPLCGAGEDRFRVMPDGSAFCRVCLPKGGPRFGELLRAVFPDRYGADTRRTHVPLAGDRTVKRPRGPRESPPRRRPRAPERETRPSPMMPPTPRRRLWPVYGRRRCRPMRARGGTT